MKPGVSRPKIKYAVQHDPFYAQLKAKIDSYLEASGESRYAGPRMWKKTATIIVLFLFFGGLVYFANLTGAAFILVMALWMFTQFLMTIGIAHDAAHDCYTRGKRSNRAIMYLFDAIGISSEHWIENHIHAHHSSPNVPGMDSAIESFSLMRLHPKTRAYRIQRLQHLYMFGIYSVATLFQVYLLEFVSIAQGLVGFDRSDTSGGRKALLFLVQKLAVLGYSLILPLWLLPNPASEVVLGWLFGHVLCGLALGIIFMTTHLHQATEFLEPDPLGRIHDSFARSVLRTTADVAPNNRFYTWISGGLNHHVAHHLFPTISQIHLPIMTKIVKETAKEFGVPYYEYSFIHGIRSHLRLLKKLGALPDAPG